MVGVVEDHDRGAAGGQARDLDRVLDGLGAGVEERGGLVEVARGQARELLADLDVVLVGRDHEAGVREVGHRAADRLDDLGHRVADGGDGDARAQVEQAVAVDVLEDGALAALDVDREPPGQPGADDLGAALVELARLGPGQLGQQLALGAQGGEGRRHGAPLYARPSVVLGARAPAGRAASRRAPRWRRRWDLNPRCPMDTAVFETARFGRSRTPPGSSLPEGPAPLRGRS